MFLGFLLLQLTQRGATTTIFSHSAPSSNPLHMHAHCTQPAKGEEEYDNPTPNPTPPRAPEECSGLTRLEFANPTPTAETGKNIPRMIQISAAFRSLSGGKGESFFELRTRIGIHFSNLGSWEIRRESWRQEQERKFPRPSSPLRERQTCTERTEKAPLCHRS